MIQYREKYNLGLLAGRDFTVKRNHSLPAKMGVEYFVFGKTMYCKGNAGRIPEHEFLHIAQFRKYGTILVILHYIFYLTRNMLKYNDFKKAFANVPFEIEAREYEKLRMDEPPGTHIRT